jgi:hypothetical protein
MKYYFNIYIFFIFAMPMMVYATPAEWDPQKVESYKGCVKCHEKQVEIWEKTKHYQTFKTLSKKAKAKEIAKIMGVDPRKIKKDKLCAGCHFTIGVKAGKVRPISGVSCESCHGPSRDWLKKHNDFGGKGVKMKFEAPEHRKERHTALDRLGMNYPGNIYGFAKNCFNCHIVANEKLVDDTKHAAGSKFNFVKRTQGDIRHGPEATAADKRKMQVIGYAVELELSLNALADATGNKRYAKEMQQRSLKALANLQDINKKIQNADVAKMVAASSKLAISAGNKAALKQLATQIASASQQFSANADGNALAALDNRKEVDAGQVVVSSASAEPAVEPKQKAKAKPVTQPTKQKQAKTQQVNKQPTVSSQPKPQEKQKAKPKVVAAAAPVPITSKPVLPGPKPTTSTSSSKPVSKPNPKPTTQPKVKQETKPVEPPSTQLAKIDTQAPIATTKPLRPNVRLIDTFEIFSPMSSKYCNTTNPWMLGQKKIGENDRLSSEDCLSLHYIASEAANVYIFNQTEDGKLIQLLPNQCNALGLSFNTIGKGEFINLPQGQQKQPLVMGLDEKKGIEWFYAVAVVDSDAENILKQHISGIANVCDGDTNEFKIDTKQFQATLTKINAETNGQLQWEGRRFYHD